MSYVDPWTPRDGSSLPETRDLPCVLVIDASPRVTEAVVRVLAADEHEVAVLGDPAELWLTLEVLAPDVVLCAVDGGDAALSIAAELHASMSGERPTFVVMTRKPLRDETAALLLRVGADDVLADAPSRPAELLARVRAGARRKRALDALRRVRTEREELRREAHTDPLTGAWNRRAFEAMLDRRVLAGEALGLLFVDVDHFKKVNDVHGHDVGDAVLVQLADALAGHLRPEDAMARLGGEEFVVIVGGADLAVAVEAAERLRVRLVAEPIGAELQIEPVTVSIGVASFRPGEVVGSDELVRRADAALYEAKRGGRNRVVGYRADLPVAKASARTLSGARRITLDMQPTFTKRTGGPS